MFPKKWMLHILVFCSMCLIGCEAPVPGLHKRVIRGGWYNKNDALNPLSTTSKQSLAHLKSLGVQWLALGPEVYMESIFAPKLRYGKDTPDYQSFIHYAKQQGFKVAILPRVESGSFFRPPYPYRADLRMPNEKTWSEFIDNYEAMLLHYARLAQETNADLFILGLEYLSFVKEKPAAWRRFANSVRTIYKGKITYSANWYEEFEAVTFWDAFDYIGIGAYFELTDSQEPTVPQLKQNWQPIIKQLSDIAKQYNKPILFTEVGYMAFADTADQPWRWQNDPERVVDTQIQAACFEALFQAFGEKSWFGGMFIWRFYSSPDNAPVYDYSPLNKPAEHIIRRWYQTVRNNDIK